MPAPSAFLRPGFINLCFNTVSMSYRRNELVPASWCLMIGLCCFNGCSLQDLDHLNSGASATGGGVGTSNHAGGKHAAAGSTAGGVAARSGGQAGEVVDVGVAGEAGSAAISGTGGAGVEGGAAGYTSGDAGRAGQNLGGSAGAGNSACGSTMTISAAGNSSHGSGLAALAVPLTSVGQGSRFNYQNFDGVGSYDLTCKKLNIVAYAPDAKGGNLHVFFTTTGRLDSVAFDVALSQLASGFQTISIPVPSAVAGGYDPAMTMVIRIEVESGSAFGASWQSPATLVYLDSISTSDGLFNDVFAASTDPLRTSGVRWQNGSTVTWVSDITVQSGTGGATGTGQAGAGGVAGSSATGNVAGNGAAGRATSVVGGGASTASGQAGTAGSR